MRLLLSSMRLLLTCLVVAAPVWGDGGCGAKIPLDMLDTTITRQLELMLPRDLYKAFTHYYFGDHIDWEELESFSIAAQVEDEVETAARRLNEAFLKTVAMRSRDPDPFIHEPIFRSPENVNNLWVSEVALASAISVLIVDQVNIFANGGILQQDG